MPLFGALCGLIIKVALRKESVDRNFHTMQVVIVIVVALRKESVDRNRSFGLSGVDTVSSLSARRAWIEIAWLLRPAGRSGSLSARRAWIEISTFSALAVYLSVALRKESVDRNKLGRIGNHSVAKSLSARRAWIEITAT